LALVLAGAGTVALHLTQSWSPFLSWLACINAVAFLFFGFDKLRAVIGGFRVPELVLHGLALLGGGAGGLAGIVLFRHKIRKAGFQAVFWAIVGLQATGFVIWKLMF